MSTFVDVMATIFTEHTCGGRNAAEFFCAIVLLEDDERRSDYAYAMTFSSKDVARLDRRQHDEELLAAAGFETLGGKTLDLALQMISESCHCDSLGTMVCYLAEQSGPRLNEESRLNLCRLVEALQPLILGLMEYELEHEEGYPLRSYEATNAFDGLYPALNMFCDKLGLSEGIKKFPEVVSGFLLELNRR